MGVESWSTSAASNTSVGGINIGEGMSRDKVNDAIRAVMADAKAGFTTQDAVDEILAAVNRSRSSLALEQARNVPFSAVADIYTGDVIPTASAPIAAKRLHADWILVRVRSTELASAGPDAYYWNEYVLRSPASYPQSFDADSVGVASGWQVVLARTYVKGRYFSWFVGPDNPGLIPNSDFAIRIGLMADTYVSSGDGGDWRYRGFGHGGMINTANTVSLDGSGTNLQDTANWAVGTTITGSTLVVDSDYRLVLPPKGYGANPFTTDGSTGVVTVSHTAHGLSTGAKVAIRQASAVGGITAGQLNTEHTITVTGANAYTIPTAGTSTSATSGGGSSATYQAEGVGIDYTLTFGASIGLRRYLKMTKSALNAASIGVQDSYAVLFGISPYEANYFKPNGLVAGQIVRDGATKPAAYPNPWNSGSASIHQAYSSLEDDILFTVTEEYGQPIRASDSSLAAFGWNNYGRRVYNDQPDFSKYYSLFASSEEGPPRTAWPLNGAIYYECSSLMRGIYNASGPA